MRMREVEALRSSDCSGGRRNHNSSETWNLDACSTRKKARTEEKEEDQSVASSLVGDSDSVGYMEETLDDVREHLKKKSGTELTKGLADIVCEQAGNNPEQVFHLRQALRKAQKEIMTEEKKFKKALRKAEKEMMKARTEEKGKKTDEGRTCRCGSVTHRRASSIKCPLNNKTNKNNGEQQEERCQEPESQAGKGEGRTVDRQSYKKTKHDGGTILYVKSLII
jgi:hypothetical protein